MNQQEFEDRSPEFDYDSAVDAFDVLFEECKTLYCLLEMLKKENEKMQ